MRLEENNVVEHEVLVIRFNSLLVRLEASGRAKKCLTVGCFNSLLVRLEEQINHDILWIRVVSIPYWCDWKNAVENADFSALLFQFLIGAIGRVLPLWSLTPKFGFQFLIGAIGSSSSSCSSGSNIAFQFLIGAIGRRFRLHWPPLVKVSIPYWCDWKNHLLVSFKVEPSVSIPYWCDWKVRNLLVIFCFLGFNSLLVRLEGSYYLKLPYCAHGFNSLLVRLEEEMKARISKGLDSFNSLLVRLEESFVPPNICGFIVSIPYWCDWKSTWLHIVVCYLGFNSLLVRLEDASIFVNLFQKKVSIPYWCDWKTFDWIETPLISSVSIPYWCDWKGN